MNIAEYLAEEAVLPNLDARTGEEVLAELTAPLHPLHPELDGLDLVRILRERENLGSTAVGDGVAIPHGKVPDLSAPALAVGLSKEGIDFAAPDGKPCHIFFLILTPAADAAWQHLRLLAQIARRAKDPIFRSEVLLAKNRDQLRLALIAP